MENIRASEIITYRKKNFFGFSRFLLVVFALGVWFTTTAMVYMNSQLEDPALFNMAPAIAAIAIATLMFFMFVAKGKYVQMVFALVFIAFNVLLLTRVIDLPAMAMRIKEAKEAAGSSSSSSSASGNPMDAFANFGDTFATTDGILIFAMSVGSGVFGLINFIFAIKALRVVRAESINNAIKARIDEIRANPDSARNAGKRLMKRLNKMARKERYVDFCHELKVLCILDEPSQNDKYFLPGESKFTGNVIVLGLLHVLWGFLNIITLGIMIPWTTSWKYKYYAERTTYSGKKVKFDGKGIQLLGRWILWELLTIVTVGIYAFFMAIALKKWVIKHQHFEDEPEAESEYTGTTFGRGLMVFFLRILQGITLGFATPYVENKIARYDMEHTSISGHPLVFGGTAKKLLGNYMLWTLFSIITIGVYAILVLPMNMNKYTVKHSRVRDMSYDPASDPR